jgi:hypothetical protein
LPRFTRQDACVFERDGISFLRHDAAGLHIRVAQSQKVKFLHTPEEQVLHQFARFTVSTAIAPAASHT